MQAENSVSSSRMSGLVGGDGDGGGLWDSRSREVVGTLSLVLVNSSGLRLGGGGGA